MKLSASFSRVLSLLLTMTPEDPILQTAKALGPEALGPILDQSPAFRDVLVQRIDEGITILNIARAEFAGIPMPPAQKEDAAKITITDQAVRWLRTNPGKHAPADIRRGLGVDPGRVLGPLGDRPEVQHEGQGAGRKYWV